MKNKNPDKLNKYIRFSTMAFEMMAVIGGLTWLGVWLDTKTNSETPWFTIILAPFSVFAAIFLVLKGLNKMNNE